MNRQKALICVDLQNDFCPGGSLAVNGGDKVCSDISEYLNNVQKSFHPYDIVVSTMDWHIKPGNHFAEVPDYKDTWPAHCVAETPGADFHENFNLAYLDAVVLKGEYLAAYSGFDGHVQDRDITLHEYLQEQHITDVDVCGLATDYCVRATALDAQELGYRTTVLSHLSAAVSEEREKDVFAEFVKAGVGVRTG